MRLGPEGTELPEDVVRLILDYADSVPRLETLLMIWENAPRAWSEQDIAARIYLPVDAVRQILRELQRKGLLTETPERLFGLTEETGLREIAGRIAQLYRSNVSRVATMIHLRAPPAVREFARAFRLKDEK